MRDAVSHTETSPGTTADAPTWLPEWDSSYAANTGHHRVHDAWYLETTPLRPGDRVLDLGCGSGDFTRVVAELVPDGHVVGLDPQPALLDLARSLAAPNQSFVEATVQDLGRVLAGPVGAEPFDLVMSRSALHWVPLDDHPGFLAAARAALRSGGRLRLEFGGAGNIVHLAGVAESVSARFGGPGAPWAFPDAGTYFDLLEHAGFVVDADRGDYVRTVAQRRAFTRDELVGWLTSQCAQAFEAAMAEDVRPRFRAALVGAVDEMRRADGSYDQTFVRLDALATRPA